MDVVHVSYLYTCEACAPDGLSVEEYATRPLASVCLVCGAEARHWYTNAERVLRALLIERKAQRRLPAILDNITFLQTWMRTSNPMLGGAVPLEMMKGGLGQRLALFIEQAHEASSKPD